MTAVTLQPDAAAANLVPPRAAAAPAPGPVTAPRAPVSLRRNFLETLSGTLVYAGCQWGVLVALAKLGNPQVVGVYALALAITSPVMLLSNLQLREVQATDARREYSPGEYLALRLLCTGLMLAVIAVMIAVMHPPRTTVWVIAWIALAKAADSVGDILFGLLQQKEWMRPVGVAQALNGLVTVGATGLAMWLTRSVAWAAAASAFGSAVALGFAWATTVRLVGAADARPRWHASALKVLAIGSLPLGIVALLVSLNTNMPRYFVEHFAGERGLGLFAAIAYIQTAGAMVAAALAAS